MKDNQQAVNNEQKNASDWKNFNALLYKMAHEIWKDMIAQKKNQCSQDDLPRLVHKECLAYIERESPETARFNSALTHYFIIAVLGIILDFNGMDAPCAQDHLQPNQY